MDQDDIEERKGNFKDNHIEKLEGIYAENECHKNNQPAIIAVHTGCCQKNKVEEEFGSKINCEHNDMNAGTCITKHMFDEYILPFLIEHNVKPYLSKTNKVDFINSPSLQEEISI